MNKKRQCYVLILILGLINFTPCFAKNEGNNIFSNSKTIEETINLQNIKIDDYIPFEIIYSIYEKQCPNDSIIETQTLINDILPTRDNNIPNYKFSLTMKKRFSTIAIFIPQIKQDNINKFCKQKYAFWKLLEATQTLYIQNLNPSYTRPSLTTHGSANNKNTSTSNFITIKNNTSNLDESDKHFINEANQHIQKEIGNLIKLKLLDADDLKALNNKISINYKKSCENTKGSFHMTQNKGGANKQFKSIELNINLCNSSSFQKNYENYVKQIFIHEISHYIYVFKDTNTNNFTNICRNKKNNCKDGEFVSKYAQNSAAEDYAESLAYRYLDNFNGIDKEKGSATTKALGEKMLYFNDLLKRLQ